MKAHNKIAAKRQQRTRQHQTAIEARRRKGISNPEQGFKFPGSNNLKKG